MDLSNIWKALVYGRVGTSYLNNEEKKAADRAAFEEQEATLRAKSYADQLDTDLAETAAWNRIVQSTENTAGQRQLLTGQVTTAAIALLGFFLLVFLLFLFRKPR